MSVLSWGKCLIEEADSTDGKAGDKWTPLDIPKQDSTKLTPTAGTQTDATQEGGDLVDSRKGKTKYVLEWDLFVKKGGKAPFEDEDGVIAGEHALRVTPEDKACQGILIERCTLSVDINYTTADGILLHYTATALKPAEGNTVKFWTATDQAATPKA